MALVLLLPAISAPRLRIELPIGNPLNLQIIHKRAAASGLNLLPPTSDGLALLEGDDCEVHVLARIASINVGLDIFPPF
ncbi:MAG: hypothetical protein IPM55_13390 [Acidobacteria bacterium]|nr:hypothetical protein [Acidobacteriota bacterium]